MQCGAEDSQEDDRRNNTLQGEEILNLGVRDAQEWNLEQEVQEETNHAAGSDALTDGDVVGNVGKAGPDGCEQNSHALAPRCRLDTVHSQSLAEVE